MAKTKDSPAAWEPDTRIYLPEPQLSRLDSFLLGIICAEVQRKGIGLSPACIVDAKGLAVKVLAVLDA